MSRKRKSTKEDEGVKSPESTKVTYTSFFHEMLAKKLVNKWQEAEIRVFFKSLGLSEYEPQDTYKDALLKY